MIANSSLQDLGSRCLNVLLTCRQFHRDFSRLAWSAAQFLVIHSYHSIPRRLATLRHYPLSSIRHLTFVAGNSDMFENMIHWKNYPFDQESLKLQTLTVAVQRNWGHFWARDDTADQMGEMLKRLCNVKVFIVTKNGAQTKPMSWVEWYRAIVWRLLSEEQRWGFNGPAPVQEMERWIGSFSHELQRFCLEAR